MDPSSVFHIAGGLLMADVARAHDKLAGAIRRREFPVVSSRRWPLVSVIRPIRGLDPGARENIEAAFLDAYAGEVETIFVFDTRNEPALPLVEAAIARHASEREGRSARVLIAGHPPEGRTGKLNAMIVAMQSAKGEIIAVCDSDTRPHPDTLRALVGTLLGAADSGSAFTPVVVPGPPTTSGDLGYALMVNALYGPLAASAAEGGRELPFIMGQFMVFRRAALDAIGGLESTHGQLVDDMYIGRKLHAAGYRNLVAPRSVPIIEAGMSWADFIRTYRRWIIFSRSGLPSWSFKLGAWLRGAQFWAGIALAVAAFSNKTPMGAALPIFAALLSSWSLLELNRAFGGALPRPKHWWVALAVFLAAPFVYASIYLRPVVSWRGRDYRLDSRGRLLLTQAPAH